MIYTFGDGFAAGHIWPEWPQLVEVLTQQPVKNFGHIGAGNEYIYNCATKASLSAKQTDMFLIQWTDPVRFDKIIEDEIWHNLHRCDPVYKDISMQVFDQYWWSTSASQLPEITKYKEFYVQQQQSINRSVLNMITLSKMLSLMQIRHLYFLTYPTDYSTHSNFEQLKQLPWVNFPYGMDDWTKNHPSRGTEIQPSTLSQLDFIKSILLPDLNDTKFNAIRSLIEKVEFKPFDPDREHIWATLKNEITLLFK